MIPDQAFMFTFMQVLKHASMYKLNCAYLLKRPQKQVNLTRAP